jgi:KilA-N domain
MEVVREATPKLKSAGMKQKQRPKEPKEQMSLKLNNVVIESRSSDNFISATQLCKAGGRKFKDWFQLDQTKRLITLLENTTNSKVVDVKKGGDHSGSWIHPRLATALALWVSPPFYIHVSQWIEEWKASNVTNPTRFMDALQTIEPSLSNQEERQVQEQVARELNGLREVKTPVGLIDVLTSTHVIEVKEVSKWKHAVGQVLCYAEFYPTQKKMIYLFGDQGSEKGVIEIICGNLDVEVRWYASK